MFGVGGAGGNAVNNVTQAGLLGCDFVVANTAAQALAVLRDRFGEPVNRWAFADPARVRRAGVRAVAWDPVATRLALGCASPSLYLWSPGGASCVQIPEAAGSAAVVAVRKLAWTPDGSTLIVSDNSGWCACFPAPSSE